ncbi:unnamed protein product [Tilletia laevis]|uniref:Ada DNA repair metal-binding domain-containing protein n=3 Tax=Tilletia TaxID=13289 RepID=A0A8X7T0L0_9BASI|nr:hypothetical protein CF336_g439 [Tilletia laevis]KAE8205590.1 hypothetical protein CF328_g404 [Tilletia controversa]KAE8265460.1 hypothetical protein A4X03_0g259 [Tilletia caries]KAE8255277.1 hypothetical protein A4X06_0g500 [Tilletia controversa]CAD6896234.1 unnamed protein product [Tilletia laevis]
MADPRSQHGAFLPQHISSGMLPYHTEAPVRPPIPTYSFSPDTAWTQASSAHLMPAIEMSSEHSTLPQLTPIHDPSSAMFLPTASAGMPATPLPTSGNATDFGSGQADAYSPNETAPVSPVESLSWNVFPPPVVFPQSGSNFASQGPFPFPPFRQQEAVGMADPYLHHLPHQQLHAQPHSHPQGPALAMGWAHAASQMVKAETLPPDSPESQEENVPVLYRHVSAPSTPIAPLENGRAFPVVDFRHGPTIPQHMHPSTFFTSSPHVDSTQQMAGPSNMPMFQTPQRVDYWPSNSAAPLSDTAPIPYLDRSFSTEQSKYEAVLARSHAADRAFFCGATNTRIYCRPSCASKRPDRSRLQFFCNPNGADKAEQAGYRPCKRCKPQMPGTVDQCVRSVGECARHMVTAARNPSVGSPNDDDDDEVRRGTLKDYSARANLSAFHFHRTFKAVTSVTLGELGKALNTLALQDALGEWKPSPPNQLAGPSSMSMRLSPPPSEDIAHLLVGWSARRARRALGGLAPSVYAAGCPHVVIRHVTTDSAFGPIAILFMVPPSARDTKRASVLSQMQLGSSPMPVTSEEGPYFGRQGSVSHQFQLPIDALPSFPPANAILLGCILGQNAETVVQRRFPSSVAQPHLASWIRSTVEELHRIGSREVQLPPEVVGAVRRARVYIEVMHQMGSKRPSSDVGITTEASTSSTSLDQI